MNEQVDEIMTLEELSIYLKIPKSTVYKLVQEGRIPGQKLGKQWRFGKKAIDEWLNTQPSNSSVHHKTGDK